MRDSRLGNYISIAEVVARRSTCQRRSVGAVIVNSKGQIAATGYNGVPTRFEHCIDVPCMETFPKSGQNLEKCHAVHAEQNALIQCSDPFDISLLIVTTFPCIHCQKMFLNTSCHTIAYGDEYDTEIIWNREVICYKQDRTLH